LSIAGIPACPACAGALAATQLHCPRCETEVRGSFEVPLARLSMQQQAFAVRFLIARGNLKEMERIDGVSYQALRSQLDDIVLQLAPPAPPRSDVLSRLRRGDLKAEEALRLLETLALQEDDEGGSQDG
jgi:hypothetical protein